MKMTVVTNQEGTFHYNEKNELHREDGPAIEDADGYKGWYLNDKLHRVDGPAVEDVNGYGYKAWYLHGQRHRTDGPAIERADGYKEYWLHGVKQDPPV
jgi:hypothetical protein